MPRGSRGPRGPRSSFFRFSRSSLYSLSRYPGCRYFIGASSCCRGFVLGELHCTPSRPFSGRILPFRCTGFVRRLPRRNIPRMVIGHEVPTMMTPRNALSLSTRVLLALAWLALPAFAADPLEAREHKPKKDEAATADPGDAKDKKDEKKDDKDAPKEPEFAKVVKGAKELPGLFRVHVKEDDAKYYLEIAPDQLDVPYLLNPTLVSGIGQGFIYPSDMLPEYVVAFHKVGKTVQLIHRNTLFRADESSSLRKPATLAAPDAIVGQAKVESQPHPDRKSILIDLGSIVVGDLEGLTPALKQVFESPYQVDREGSTLDFAKNFPDNLDFETVLNFKA